MTFDTAAARERCLVHRRRILEISQRVTALHVAPAFSCLEILDSIYYGLRNQDGRKSDRVVLSKGHGCMAQYAVLESLGILPREELDRYCTPHGKLGAHPDYGNPGIEASTGSLGHGLSIAVGMACAERARRGDGRVFVVLSDGEVQEGSTWEAALMASTLGLEQVIAFVDNNDFQSLGRTSETHPSFYPLDAKFTAFGWETVEVSGHDAGAIFDAVEKRQGGKPLMLICKTVKGKGVRYMENVPIWHYRAPNPEEYRQALAELQEVAS